MFRRDEVIESAAMLFEKGDSGLAASDTPKQGNRLKPTEPTYMTISEDRTDRLAIDKRNLSALRREKTKADGGEEEGDLFQEFEPNDDQLQLIRQNRQKRRTTVMATYQEEKRQKEEKARQHLEEARQIIEDRREGTRTNRVDQITQSPGSGKSVDNMFTGPSNSNKTIQSTQLQPDTSNYRLSTEEVKALREQMALLEAKLKDQYEPTRDPPSPCRFQFLYRLGSGHAMREEKSEGESEEEDFNPQNSIFSDPPEVVYDQNGGGHLRCNLPLRNLDLFLAQNRDISFVVFQDYQKLYPAGYFGTGDISRIPQPSSESIYPVSTGLKEALTVLFGESLAFLDIETRYESTGEIFAPYHFLYHSRKELVNVHGKLGQSAREHLDLFLLYVEKGFGDEYSVVDALLKEKKITPDYISYLFKPGDVTVEATAQGYTGYITESWVIDGKDDFSPDVAQKTPKILYWPSPSPDTKRYGRKKALFMKPKAKKFIGQKTTPKTTKSLRAWTLDFDGEFSRSFKTLKIKVPNERSTTFMNASEADKDHQDITDEAQLICSLNVFPLEYAPDSVLDLLKRRGNTFWECRARRLVSYHGERSGQGVDMVRAEYFPVILVILIEYRQMKDT
jgi:hypothetical protein